MAKKKRKVSKRKVRFFFAFIVFAGITSVLGYNLFSNIISIHKMELEKNELNEKIVSLQEEKQELESDIKKLEDLAANGHTRDFKDLAKLHLATINGDTMETTEFVKFLSSMDTKKSPFYYTSRLMVAQKYLSVGDVESANMVLDKIINDSPASISATAQTLR